MSCPSKVQIGGKTKNSFCLGSSQIVIIIIRMLVDLEKRDLICRMFKWHVVATTCSIIECIIMELWRKTKKKKQTSVQDTCVIILKGGNKTDVSMKNNILFFNILILHLWKLHCCYFCPEGIYVCCALFSEYAMQKPRIIRVVAVLAATIDNVTSFPPIWPRQKKKSSGMQAANLPLVWWNHSVALFLLCHFEALWGFSSGVSGTGSLMHGNMELSVFWRRAQIRERYCWSSGSNLKQIPLEEAGKGWGGGGGGWVGKESEGCGWRGER